MKYPKLYQTVVKTHNLILETASESTIESEINSILNNKTAVKYIRDFFTSSKYTNEKASNTQFVTDVCNVSGVTLSETDKKDCISSLDKGMPRISIVNYILSDSSFKKISKENNLNYVVYDKAAAKLDKIGRNLQAAFKFSSGMKYQTMSTDYKLGTEYYADYGFNNGFGNCYSMAATFCEMARELGYNTHQVFGNVPLKAGGIGPHSWVEVNINGTVYVFDPDFTEETGKDGYKISYGQSGTWKYNFEGYMS